MELRVTKCSSQVHHLAKDTQLQISRAWYMAFTVFATSKGKYAHPYFCFRKDHLSSNHGRHRPYLHNLPSQYAPVINTWSQQIYQAMLTTKVFPAGTCDEQIRILESRLGGHRYEALLTIIHLDHPIYHPHPTSSIRNPAKGGGNEALSSYFY